MRGVVRIDISRSQLEYNNHVYAFVEDLKDSYLFSGKYGSIRKEFDSPQVVVLTNYPPNESKLFRYHWHVVNMDGE